MSMSERNSRAQIGDFATDRQAVTLDESGRVLSPPPPARKRPKNIKLSSVSDVAEELARLYRQARAGEVETADASRLCYVLNTLASVLETAQLEARIQQLEQLAAED